MVREEGIRVKEVAFIINTKHEYYYKAKVCYCKGQTYDNDLG